MPPTDVPEVYDASDPEQIKKAKAAAELRALASREVIKSVMASPHGRNWIWDLLSVGHLYETSFDPDLGRMAFKEGERNYALQLLAQVTTASPDGYAQMMAEKGKA